MKIKLLLLSVLVSLSFIEIASAQIYAGNDTTICGGQATLIATTNSPVSGNVTIISLGDDEHSGIINLGFSFDYYGNTYTQCKISSNNYITFNTGVANYSPYSIGVTMPSATPTELLNSIMAPWQDINPGSGGQIRYATVGTAPNRIFVVEYCAIPMYSCTGMLFTSEIKLFETSNIIETHLTSKPICSGWNGGKAIHGLNNVNGTIAHIIPGRNNPNQWTTTNEGYQFVPTSATNYNMSLVPFNPIVLGASPVNWTVLGGGAAGTGDTITVSPTVTTTYVAEFVYNTCASITNYTDTVTVFVGGASSNAGPDNTFCGLAGNLSGSNPVPGVGTWTQISGPGTLNFTSPNAQNTALSASSAGIYEITWSITGACAATDTVEITLDEVPVPSNAGPDQAVCGLTVTLAGNPPSVGTGTWTQSSGPGILIFNNINSPTTTATAPFTGVYVIEWTIVNASCSTTDNVTISFDEAPTPANAGQDKTICGQTTVMSGNTATVGTGQWSQVSGPGTLTFATPNNPGSTVSVNGAPWSYGTYLIGWTITNGMCSSSDTVQIIFDQPVSPANGGQDFEICGNTIPILGGIDPAIGTGQWIQIFGMDTANFSDTLFHNSAVSVNSYGQYTVSWTVTNGSCSSSDTIFLVFKEAPTTALAGPSQEICGLSTSMAGNIALAGQGLWTKLSGPGNLSFVNTTGSNSSVVASAYGDYIIKWTISNFDCISEDTLRVTFYESPSKANAGKDTLLCNLKEHYLNAVSPVVGAGTWSVSKGPSIIFDPTLNNSLVIDLETGINEFVWTTKNGVCPLSNDTMIITISKAEAHFESNYYALYVDDILQLVDSSLINPVKWSWTFGDGGTSFIQNPKHAYIDTGLFSINLVMENEYGCVDSLEKMVKVYKPFTFYVPNSFTPNGDGLNDEFRAYGDGISEFQLLIFNRWGELIFRNSNIDIGWNGRKNNGSGNVLPGVYVYKLSAIDYHGTEKKQEGTITIIK